MTALTVFLHERKVGRLWVADKRQQTCQYDADWLTAHVAVPISISLPLQTVAFDDELARPFFANLLPEAEQRKIIAGNIGASLQFSTQPY